MFKKNFDKSLLICSTIIYSLFSIYFSVYCVFSMGILPKAIYRAMNKLVGDSVFFATDDGVILVMYFAIVLSVITAHGISKNSKREWLTALVWLLPLIVVPCLFLTQSIYSSLDNLLLAIIIIIAIPLASVLAVICMVRSLKADYINHKRMRHRLKPIALVASTVLYALSCIKLISLSFTPDTAYPPFWIVGFVGLLACHGISYSSPGGPRSIPVWLFAAINYLASPLRVSILPDKLRFDYFNPVFPVLIAAVLVCTIIYTVKMMKSRNKTH